MAILGGVLVAVLVAGARLTTQQGRAAQRLEACRMADGLLESWWPEREKLPRRGGGAVPGADGWSWRTLVVENAEAEALGAEVVALEIADARQPDAALVRVELLLARKADADAGGGTNAH
jgi:hypothetical protein